MSATQAAVTKQLMMPENLSQYPFFRYANKTQVLRSLPLSEVATFEWGKMDKKEAGICAMYFVIIGHPEASTEELLKAANDLGISNKNLTNAAVIANHEDLYQAVIAQIDPNKFKKDAMEWVYALASFGTPKLYDAFVNQLQRLNIAILPMVQQNLSELIGVTTEADNFEMMLHFATLASSSLEDVAAIFFGNKMKPYYKAAEKGRLDVVAWFQEKMSQFYDKQTLQDFSQEAFDRATHFGHVQLVQYLLPKLSGTIHNKLSGSLKALKQFQHEKGDDPTKITFSGKLEIADVASTIRYQICIGDSEDLDYWLANPILAAELTKPEFRAAFAQGGDPAILKLLEEASQKPVQPKTSFSVAYSNHGHFQPADFNDSDFEDILDSEDDDNRAGLS
jgi:hypothetical protein